MRAPKIIASICVLACAVAQGGLAAADSLYSAPLNYVATGHSLHLAADHRAMQIGDLVAVQFDFNVTSASNATNNQSKAFSLAIPGATGNAHILFFANPTGASGATSSSSAKAKSDTSNFSTIMMSSVVGILPSGAMVIRGKQNVMIDGQKRTLNVEGTVRYEDIDTSDTVSSSRIADVSAAFDGDDKSDHKGLIQKVLDVLF